MKKRSQIAIVLALSLILGFSSCKKEKEQVPQTVIGYVADATMNNVMIITNAGDTLNISTMDADPTKVQGVLLKDSVKVTYIKEKIDQSEILKAQELTITVHSPFFYIKGTWLEPNPIKPAESQGVTLNEDGSAVSVGMATLLFKTWVLDDNKLMLTYESIGNKQTLEGTDTLKVEKLDADSLVLSSNGSVTWSFGRAKN